MSRPETRMPPPGVLEAGLREAVSLMQQGQQEAAQRRFSALLATGTSWPPLLHFAGLNAIERGQADDGLRLLRRSIELAPHDFAFQNNLANALTRLKRWEEAEELIRPLLERDPKNPQLLFGMANLLHLTARDGESTVYWKAAMEVAPDWPQIWLGLGETLAELGDSEGAERAYEQAQKHRPADPLIRTARADVLAQDDQNEAELVRARALYEEALRLKPGFEPAEAGLAGLEGQHGQFDEALERLRRMLRASPPSFLATWLLARFKRFQADDPDLKLIEPILSKAQREPENPMAHQVFFAWGKIQEDLGNYEAAWQAYVEGQSRKPVDRAYSERVQRQYLRLLQKATDAAFLEKNRIQEPAPVRPLYIVGMPRSGTTLIEQMLSVHPAVATSGEMIALQNSVRRGLDILDLSQLPYAFNPLKPAAWRRLRTEVDRLYIERSGGRAVLTDKMPSNFMNVGWLAALYPDARFLHIRRDPRDTCVSCYTTLFRSSQKFSSNLTHLGHYYRMYEALMEGWRSFLPDSRLLEIRYEELVEKPKEVLERVLRFAELPWHEECLHPERATHRIRTASLYQARQPIRTGSIGRWQRFASHLGPLEEALAIEHPLADPPGDNPPARPV